MADAHANFATSLVATAPSPATSGTSLVVTTGEGTRFPATPFNAVICPAGANATPANAEVIRVTTRSTDTFSVIARAQEGSSARTVIVGDRIYAGPTAKSLTDIENDLISETIVDAKGDLIVATAADTLARKAVGADGAVLTTKAGDSDGLRWKEVTARSPWEPQGMYSLIADTTLQANHLYLVPVFVPEYVTLTGVRFRIGNTTTGNCKAAVYAGDGQTLLGSSGATAVAAANTIQSVPFGIATTQLAGTYWAGIAVSGASSIYASGALEYLGPALDLSSSYTTLPTTITPTAVQSALARNPWLQLY